VHDLGHTLKLSLNAVFAKETVGCANFSSQLEIALLTPIASSHRNKDFTQSDISGVQTQHELAVFLVPCSCGGIISRYETFDDDATTEEQKR